MWIKNNPGVETEPGDFLNPHQVLAFICNMIIRKGLMSSNGWVQVYH